MWFGSISDSEARSTQGLAASIHCYVKGSYSDLEAGFYHYFWGHFIQDFSRFSLWRKGGLWWLGSKFSSFGVISYRTCYHMSSQMALQRMLLGMEAVLHPSPRWNHLLPLHPSWWPELQLQSRSTRPESCHRTPDWGRLQPAEYRLAVWFPVCSSVSDKWPHRLSHPAATQQPAYSIRQQQSSAPVGASTCWHCWKRDCRQTGKGSSKTPSTSLLHHIQRSQDPSETEAEISLEIKKQWIWPAERPD